ncbi:MAG: ATP-binding protein [Lacrimispora saccharolytica]
METIEKISRQQQSRVGIRLRQSISEILSELTDGKYRQVSMDDDLKIGIHSENYYVPLEKTSRGTMEQVYFALRMAVMDILCSEEEMPVLLDETFAMYDEYRLERALTWLANKKRQVVIFTCQKREEQTLDRLGIPYHKVDLSVDL